MISKKATFFIDKNRHQVTKWQKKGDMIYLSSFVKAQIKAITQPTKVQPRRRFRAMMAFRSLFSQPATEGKKYKKNPNTIKIIKEPVFKFPIYSSFSMSKFPQNGRRTA